MSETVVCTQMAGTGEYVEFWNEYSYFVHQSHPTVRIVLCGIKGSDQLSSLSDELPVRMRNFVFPSTFSGEILSSKC